MDASHSSLRDLYECSCPELDGLVLQAREAGAFGSRLTGENERKRCLLFPFTDDALLVGPNCTQHQWILCLMLRLMFRSKCDCLLVLALTCVVLA